MTTRFFKSAQIILSLFPKISPSTVKPFRVSILLLHLAALSAGSLAYPKATMAEESGSAVAQQVCANTTQAARERELVGLIDKIQRDSDEVLTQLEDIRNGMSNYSDTVENANRFIQNSYGWNATLRSARDTIASTYLNAPGGNPDFNYSGVRLQFNPLRALDKVLNLFSTLKPSEIFSWTIGARLTIVETKLIIKNSATERSNIFSQQLTTLRAQCRNGQT